MGRQQRIVLILADAGSDGASWQGRVRQAGFDVLTCEHARAALDLADTGPIDLFAIDLRSAGRALEGIRTLRQSGPGAHAPILIVGEDLRPEWVAPAIDAGADDCISASFTADELRTRVSLLMRARRRDDLADMAGDNLRRRLDAMALLHGFYEKALANDGVAATCRQSAETAALLVGSNRVSVLLADARAHCLKFSHALGMEDSVWQDRQVPLSSPVAGRVLATGREIVVNGDTAWPRRGRYRSAQFVSMPLIRGSAEGRNEVLGVLNVTEPSTGSDYQPQDVLALRQLARATAFAIDAVRTRRKLDETRDSIIFSLARLSEYRHASTGKHLERVRELSLVLARHLADDPRVTERIDAQFLADLGRAAPLHDVGKVAIPDRILLKEGRLTAEEFEIIRNHTGIGAATLQSVMAAGHDDSFLKMAMEIAHCHHERYDGSGYPRGLVGEEIPLSARVVCLADSYDAIRMPREYKPARTHADATRELLLGSGTQFDPVVVQTFCAVESEFVRIYSQMEESARCGETRNPLDALATA